MCFKVGSEEHSVSDAQMPESETNTYSLFCCVLSLSIKSHNTLTAEARSVFILHTNKAHLHILPPRKINIDKGFFLSILYMVLSHEVLSLLPYSSFLSKLCFN